MAKIWLNLNKKTVALILLAVFLLFIDRQLKSLSLADFQMDILGEWLRFSFVPNYGIAFSLPIGGLLLNILIIVILAFLLIWGARLQLAGKIYQFTAIVLIILGAMSNLGDRLIHGYVIDYLDLQYFTVFNIADVLICAGVGWLIWQNKEDRSK